VFGVTRWRLPRYPLCRGDSMRPPSPRFPVPAIARQKLRGSLRTPGSCRVVRKSLRRVTRQSGDERIHDRPGLVDPVFPGKQGLIALHDVQQQPAIGAGWRRRCPRGGSNPDSILTLLVHLRYSGKCCRRNFTRKSLAITASKRKARPMRSDSQAIAGCMLVNNRQERHVGLRESVTMHPHQPPGL